MEKIYKIIIICEIILLVIFGIGFIFYDLEYSKNPTVINCGNQTSNEIEDWNALRLNLSNSS